MIFGFGFLLMDKVWVVFDVVMFVLVRDSD